MATELGRQRRPVFNGETCPRLRGNVRRRQTPGPSNRLLIGCRGVRGRGFGPAVWLLGLFVSFLFVSLAELGRLRFGAVAKGGIQERTCFACSLAALDHGPSFFSVTQFIVGREAQGLAALYSYVSCPVPTSDLGLPCQP